MVETWVSASTLAQQATGHASRTPLWIIIGYLGLLLGLGVVVSRFFRGTSKDYFVASRSIGPFLLLMSVFGTTMTGFALVGSTAKSFTHGIGVYGLMASWSGLVHSAVFFLVGIRLWAIGKRYGYVTQVQFFRDRFQSPALGYMLFPILVLLVLPYLLVGIISACKVMQPLTMGMFPETFAQTKGAVPGWVTGLGISAVVLFYVFVAGVRSAAWANTFQTIVFMITGVITFYMISSSLGGLDEAGRMVLDQKPSRADRSGMGKWMFASYVFVPLSVGMFPHLFQHWLTARTAKTFRLTVIAHPIFIMIVWVPCILIGMWAAGLYSAGDLKMPTKANGEPIASTALAMMVRTLVENPFLTGLLSAGIMAAIMSSLDSQFVCLGTMFTNDIVAHSLGEDRFTDRQMVWLARGFVVTIVAIAYGLSMWLINANVFDLGIWCFSGFAALFPLVFAAVYWRRATRAGAIACVIVTAVVWLAFFIDDIVVEGTNLLGEHTHGEYLVVGVMPVTFIFLASAVTLVGVSLLTRPLPTEATEKFFIQRTGDAGQPGAVPPPAAGTTT